MVVMVNCMSLIFMDIQNHFILQTEVDCMDFIEEEEEASRNYFNFGVHKDLGIHITSLVNIPNFIMVEITNHIIEEPDFKIQIKVDMHSKILAMVVVSLIIRMLKEV